MKYTEVMRRYFLYFSSWKKKGYSIFAGLGREVRISRLSIHMYGNVLLKSASKGVIINMDKVEDILLICPAISKENLLSFIVKQRREVCLSEINAMYNIRKGYIAVR